MSNRDLAWRPLGVAYFVIAVVIGLDDRFGGGVKLLGFGLAIVGLVLMVQGGRAAAAWRVERSRHRALAQAIGERHRRSSRRAH